MTELADLGIRISSTGVVEAKTGLQDLSANAGRAEQATESLGRASQATSAKVGALGDRAAATGAQTRGMSGGFRNLGLQLNQVAQVGGMTGNWMQAIAVQLPDILMGFGTMGIVAGIAAGAMIPLLSSLTEGGNSAEKMRDRMDDLSSQVDAYAKSVSSAETANFGFGESFDGITYKAREALDIINEAQARQTRMAIDEVTASLFENLKVQGRFKAVKLADYFDVTGMWGWMGLSDDMRARLLELQGLFNEFEATEGMEQKADVGRTLLRQLTDMAEEIDGINEEEQALIDGLARAVLEMDKLAAIDIESGIRRAAVAASDLARNLRDARAENQLMAMPVAPSESAAIAKMRADFASGKLSGGRGSVNPTAEDAVFAAQGGIFLGGDGAGGGRKLSGGGTSQAERELSKRMSEAKRLFDQTRTAAEEYNAELANMRSLYEDGLISQEVFTRATGALQDEFLGISDAIRATDGAFENFAVSVLSRSESVTDALSNLTQQFANMALQSAVSGLFSPISSALAPIFSIPGRATGGPVEAGQPYTINEHLSAGRPTEVFVPSANGAVMNVQQAQDAMGGGTSMVFAPVIHAEGADATAIARLEGRLNALVGEFEARVVRAVRGAQSSRVLR